MRKKLFEGEKIKKMVFFSIMLAVISLLSALKSEPSTAVGFVKVEAPTNGWTMLALPFDVDGCMVSSVFSDGSSNPYITGGTNPGLSDQIQEVGGSIAWYNSGTSLWMGSFAVDVTRAYYSVIRSGHPDADLYVCGSVDNTTVASYEAIPANAWTAIGFREAGEVLVGDLGLLEAGFTGGTNPGLSDQIQEVGGSISWYNSASSVWMPSTFTIKPGKAYYLVIRNGHSGLASYSYPPSSDFTPVLKRDLNKPARIKK
ncbi:MAG: hypothetical protein Q7J16_05495 [Candidatus Cloacimonadales bacterium]|nr:hypothetical protein [Candidatus Cloacimonadales bacterium]